MVNYYLFADEAVQGPYTEEEIRSRIKSNEVGMDAQVSGEGGGWQRLGDVFPTAVRMPPHLVVSPPPATAASAPVRPTEARPAEMKPPLVKPAEVKSSSVVVPVQNPYAPPRAALRSVVDRRRPMPSYYGGISRLGFVVSYFLALVGLVLLFKMGPQILLQAWPITIPLALLLVLALFWYRLKNIGYNPAWSLIIFVPLLGQIMGAYCIFAPEGYAEHKELDLAGKLLLLLILAYVGLVIFEGVTGGTEQFFSRSN